MTLQAAITQFKTWTPTDFLSVEGLDDYHTWPIPDEKMPMALLTMSGLGGQGYAPYEFGGDFNFAVAATVYLVAGGLGMPGAVESELITMFDNFAVAVEADPRLNDNLQRPMMVELVSTAPVSIAGYRYRAWELRLVWIVKY